MLYSAVVESSFSATPTEIEFVLNLLRFLVDVARSLLRRNAAKREAEQRRQRRNEQIKTVAWVFAVCLLLTVFVAYRRQMLPA